MADALPTLLAPGRYWIDLIGKQQIGNFGAGIKGLNDAHPGIVRIISATHHAANDVRTFAESPDITGTLTAFWEQIAGDISDTPEHDWVLFEVTAPAVWDRSLMGTPNKAGPNVTSEADTVQRADPEKDVTDTLPTAGDVGKGIASAANTLVWIVGLALAAAILLRAKGKTTPGHV